MKILIGGIRVCGKLPPLFVPLEVLSLPSSQVFILLFLTYSICSWPYFFMLSPLGIPIFLSLQLLPLCFFLSVNSFFETVFPHSTACEIHEHYSISKIQPTFSPPSLTFTYIHESHYPSSSYQPQHFEIILTSHFQTWKKNLVL